MGSHEGRSWRILGRNGAWVMGLAVLACAPGDANRGGDTAAVATSTGGVAATPSATTDTAQSTTATGADTAAAGQTQTTADTASQQAAASADTGAATTAQRSKALSPTRSRTAATAEPSASGDTAAATSSTDTATSTGTTASTDTAAAQSETTAANQQATPAGQTGAQQGGDKMVVSEEVYNGWKTFNANCNRCHGDDAIAAAGGIAPDLRQSIEQGRVNHDVYTQVVVDGRIEKGMPPWKDLLTEKQIEDVWQYLVARTKGGLPPGRPKRKEG